MIETVCRENGICCESCQEDVNIHRCEVCFQRFEDGDEICCEYRGNIDSAHWHKECADKTEGKKEE